MDQPGSFSQARVLILGLGLMGGSLALALRGHCAALLGVEPDPQTRQFALEHQIVDEVSVSLAELLPSADLLVLAAPVSAIVATLESLPDLPSGQLVVVDLGSTKTVICQAMRSLPERFEPVGGHPMCGKEKSSLLYADQGLFQKAAFALVDLPNSTARARDWATQMALAVGALPFWIDATSHDQWTAATSHLPYLLATALAGATPPETAVLVGTGWRGMARLAGSSVPMMYDVIQTNREALLARLAGYQAHLAQVERWIADEDWEALRSWMESSQAAYQHISDQTP